ncbi:DUF7144 family membrane protein [Kitasatospora camelliae]|uniref:DUF7144 domain-containing protein n=1 Tax=Kitasatospora camelliae TaxID=3156397 RepID=A0AAU8JQK5_9ACTN
MSGNVQDRGTTHPVASGVVAVTAVMMLIAGVLNLLRGIMAIANDEVYATTPNYVFKFDLTAWGWIHVVLAVLAVLVGVGLFRLALWARIAALIVASLLIIANFLSIPYYPLWSLTVIAVCLVAIWGLAVVHRDR